jgi:hypothetical protein
MAVPGVDVGAERGEVERQLPGSVRAVDDRDRAGFARSREELLEWEADRGRRGDVADEQDPRARAERV